MSTISKWIIILAIASSTEVASQSPDNTVRADVCGTNPAAARYALSSGKSTGYVSYAFDRYGDASLTQTGQGGEMLTIGAMSWMPLDTVQTVWGWASYSTGRHRDIRWANAVDIDRVGPYVIGDGVGGDLSAQVYDFGGGYARGLGRKFTLGVSLGYRAEIDYRRRDPRLKAIVSDLDLAAGVSYRLPRDMQVAASVSFNLYNQDDDVDYYSSDNALRVYPLTGLGTVYSRFSGMTGDFATAYKGIGWGVGLALLPSSPDARRLTVSVRMDDSTTDLIMRGYNNLTLTQLERKVYGVSVSRPVGIGTVVLTPEVEAWYHDVSGRENLFGSAVGNVYEKIGSRTPYSHTTLDACVRVKTRWTVSSDASIVFAPGVSFITDSEEMSATDRRLDYRVVTPSLQVDWSQRWSSLWSTGLKGMAGRRMAKPTEVRLTGLDVNDAIGSMVVADYDYLTSDATDFGGELSLTRRLRGRISLELNVRYVHSIVVGHDSRRQLLSSLSVNF